ncbi:diaminopimelate epimerase [uncultured Sphingomonas sp.]|uniref:diaminopimelate epimerase n=1 Tax=uncultured Sphingomonas sp. TaxID=158754 RepID=UPI0035CB961D
MRFAITHCHGSGNDFPLIDARGLDVPREAWPIVARALADRGGPVGGDGLLLLVAGEDSHDFGMVMFNADGSESPQCLNGLRCVGRAGLAAGGIDHARVKLVTSSAEVWAEPPLAPGVVTIGERAGPVGLRIADWPLAGVEADAEGRLIDSALPPLGSPLRFTAVLMPNPHLVAFVEQVDEAELVRLGEVCEAAPAWLPNRANVSFVEVRGPGTLPPTIFVRTFERGVGLTDSCGSAMAASMVAAAITRRMSWDTPVTVLNRGGRVRATAGSDGFATISGNATWEWAGEVDVDVEGGLATGVASGLVVTKRFDDEVAAWAAAVR